MSMKEHWDALIAAMPPTVAAILAYLGIRRKVDTVQVTVDGKMEQLLRATSKADNLQGRQDERDKQEGVNKSLNKRHHERREAVKKNGPEKRKSQRRKS